MKTKKLLSFAVAAIALAGCSNDVDVVNGPNGPKNDAINFRVGQSNLTRVQDLNKAGHYNFGVFAYKNTDKTNGIMDNYLVGYHDDALAYSASGTTVGDTPGQEDGKSQWMYEGLGYSEFTGTYAGKTLNAGTVFASNVDKQYLRFWDSSAANTFFYAYAPYVNTTATGKTVTYVDGESNTMTFPDGAIEHGYNDPSKHEYLYASAKVNNADYGHDVALQFKHLNAKVNIKFWENIPGYRIRIIDVNNDYSVSAVPAIKDGTSGKYGYKKGTIYSKSGATLKFENGALKTMSQLTGTTTDAPLNFAAPEEATIGENRVNASASATTYYAIPKNNDTGLTFHVTYELLSTTGEKITVKDATVFVPTDYTNWVANKHYTYIFKITKNSNGSTGSVSPDPTDPDVPTVQALYPIVFDNCTIEDWEEIDSEHNISDGTNAAYHDVELSAYSLSSGTIDVTVTDNDTYTGHGINYSNISITGPDGADMTKVTYVAGADKGTITVADGAAAGTYTVSYRCSAGAYENHPNADTWTETFEVGSVYTVALNKYVVGTGGQADSYLAITTTKDGTAETAASGTLTIDYPANVSSTDKVKVEGGKVVIAKDAPEDFYKLIYKVDGKKVDEKVFEVRSYQHNLSMNIVYLNGETQTISSSHLGSDDALSLDASAPAGLTIDGYTIKVSNDVPAGSYNVYYTVDKSDSNSKVTYVSTFEVKETIAVAVNKSSLDRNQGTSTSGQITTDGITVTTTRNGMPTTGDLTSSISIVKSDKTAAWDGDFTISYDSSANMYTVRCKNTVATGNYYVKFTQTLSDGEKSEYAIFTVQE
ncbi:MAG: fimbrillin family protein [Prevotellaceae bacterium]|nr:fimbrillin family protein [Candidatus Minthosoma equi]